MKSWWSLGFVMLALPAVAGENFLWNGNFARLCGWNNRPVAQPSTPYEGWVWSGTGKAPSATPGRIELTAPGSLLSATASATPAKEYELVFDVKTTGAKGFVNLGLTGRTMIEPEKPAPADAPCSSTEFIDGARKPTPAKYKQFGTTPQRLTLPEDTDGKFVTLATRAAFKTSETSPAEANVRFSLDLQAGSCVVANVRVELAPADPVFRPAIDEWLTVSVEGFAAEQLPSFAGPGKRVLRVTNTSGAPLSGLLTLTIGTWRSPGQGTAWKDTAKIEGLAPGASAAFTFEPGGFPPDAYVAAATLEIDGKKVVPVPTAPLPLEKKVLTSGYNRLCFAVFPAVKPADIFGVGNGMIGRFFTLDDVDRARELGLVSVQAGGMIGAAFGAPTLTSETIDEYAPSPSAPYKTNPALSNSLNPLNPKLLDIFNPEVRSEIVRRGNAFGKARSELPGVYALRVNNEKAYFNRNTHCPSAAADADFRGWCKARHGTLENLNRRWGTRYQSWDEVEQVISARMIDMAKASYEQKTGAAAVDWKASSSFLRGEGYERQLRKNWGAHHGLDALDHRLDAVAVLDLHRGRPQERQGHDLRELLLLAQFLARRDHAALPFRAVGPVGRPVLRRFRRRR